MSYNPISGFALQTIKTNGQTAEGYYLKFYIANTTTPLSMAIDNTGGTLLVKAKLNPNGMPISNPLDNTTDFIPHMSQNYRLVIYTNETDADNNTTASAFVNIAEVQVNIFGAATFEDLANKFGTVALMNASTDTNIIKDGNTIFTQGYTTAGDGGGATYLVKTTAQASTDGDVIDGFGNHTSGVAGLVLIYQKINGQVNVRAYGARGNNSTDDTASVQAALDGLKPSDGGALYFPIGKYLFNSAVSKKFDAGGVVGRGLTMVGDGFGVSTIVLGHSGYAFIFDGPTGGFTSNMVVDGIRFTSKNSDYVGKAFRLAGVARSQFNIFCYRLDIGIDMEATLLNQFNVQGFENNVSIHMRKFGHFSGDWGVTGCNENEIRGDMSRNRQYAMICDTIRGIHVLGAHFERNGTEDIAGGGVSDTDRGGVKFIDPVGTLSFNAVSSEDNGDKEGVNEGKGVVYVKTNGTEFEPWTLAFNGATFWKTLDGPISYIYIEQDGSAGYGRLSVNGGVFNTNSAYVPTSANPTFNITAAGRNMAVDMSGVDVLHGATEFSYNADVDYHIFGMPKVAQNGAHSFISTAEPNELLSEIYANGDVTGVAEEAIRSNVNTVLSTIARYLFKGANSAGDEVTYARILGVIGNNVTAGTETGAGITVDVANGAGGFATEYLLHSDGMAANGLSKKGAGSAHFRSYYVNGTAGATGTFTTADAKTVTVTNGIIVSIV
jgi:hypothetical protein